MCCRQVFRLKEFYIYYYKGVLKFYCCRHNRGRQLPSRPRCGPPKRCFNVALSWLNRLPNLSHPHTPSSPACTSALLKRRGMINDELKKQSLFVIEFHQPIHYLGSSIPAPFQVLELNQIPKIPPQIFLLSLFIPKPLYPAVIAPWSLRVARSGDLPPTGTTAVRDMTAAGRDIDHRGPAGTTTRKRGGDATRPRMMDRGYERGRGSDDGRGRSSWSG